MVLTHRLRAEEAETGRTLGANWHTLEISKNQTSCSPLQQKSIWIQFVRVCMCARLCVSVCALVRVDSGREPHSSGIFVF